MSDVYNIIICSLTAIVKGRYHFNEELTYEVAGEHLKGKTFSGFFSSEAPAKYLLHRIHKTGRVPDKIIVMSTNQCKEVILEHAENASEEKYLHKSSEDYYKDVIRKEMAFLMGQRDYEMEDDSFIFVNMDDREHKKIERIVNDVSKRSDEVRIYADLTGGSRMQMLTATMVMGFLETLNYKIECIAYANINNEQNTIEDITNYYQQIHSVIAHAKDRQKDHPEDPEVTHSLKRVFEHDETSEPKVNSPEVESYDGKKPYIFFSYRHENMRYGQDILHYVDRQGYRFWYDRNLKYGQSWDDELVRRMRECSSAIILLTKDYFKSEYCLKESKYLIKQYGKEVCVILQDGKSAADFKQYFDKAREEGRDFSDLQKYMKDNQCLSFGTGNGKKIKENFKLLNENWLNSQIACKREEPQDE